MQITMIKIQFADGNYVYLEKVSDKVKVSSFGQYPTIEHMKEIIKEEKKINDILLK